MTRGIKLLALAGLALWPTAAGAQETFGLADLTGSWSSTVRRGNSDVNDPKYGYGTTQIDAAGDVTGGDATDEDGIGLVHTGGSLTVDGSGSVAGSILNASGSDAFTGHQLDPSATLLVGVDTDPDGYRGIDVWVKRSGSFALADLEGRWWYKSHWDSAAEFNDAGWDDLLLEVSEAGVVTQVAGSGSEVASQFEAGDQLTIDASGSVGVADFPEVRLQMTPNKQVIAGVLSDRRGYATSATFVRWGGPFEDGDREGRWHVYWFFDGAFENAPSWATAVLDIDAEGVVTRGTYESPGFDSTVTSGAFGINGSGTMFGQLRLANGAQFPVQDVQLNLDADFGAAAYSHGTSRILSLWVLPEPSGTGPAAAALLALLALATARSTIAAVASKRASRKRRATLPLSSTTAARAEVGTLRSTGRLGAVQVRRIRSARVARAAAARVAALGSGMARVKVPPAASAEAEPSPPSRASGGSVCSL